MKTWLAGAVGLIGLVGVWALPPGALDLTPPERLPEQARLDEVETEIRRAHGALRALRWSEALPEVAIREAVDGVTLRPPAPERVEGGLADWEVRQRDLLAGLGVTLPPQGQGIESAVADWEARQREVLAGLPRRDPSMVVGVLWEPAERASLPATPLAGRMYTATFVGERAGTPYCIQVVPYAGGGLQAALRWNGSLGACRLYAAYGLPGGHIQEWQEASALRFARVDFPGYAASVTRSSPAPSGRTFGAPRPPLSRQNLAVQSCLAGRTSECERALVDPELVAPLGGDDAWLIANSPATSFEGGPVWSDPPFGYVDDALLYELEAAYGPDAFHRFWTSPEPVPAAFEAAFGMPLGDWVLRWADEHVGLYRAGPALPSSTLLWSLLTFAGLAGISTATAQRRRAG